jgi:hypothetical protein
MRYALLLGTLMLLLGCGGSSDPDASPPERPSSAKAFDGWHIKVSVRPSIVSPLALSVGAPRAAPQTDARAWVEHELVFENQSRRLLRFADTETSAFIGPPGTRKLIAADEGCGYAQAATLPVEAGVCRLSLDGFSINPHAKVSRTITLFKGLTGMKPLTPGTYTFKRAIRFHVGNNVPGGGEGRSAVLSIDYRLTRR